MRRKLAAYYAAAGQRDTVIVAIPTGGYAPLLRLRRSDDVAVELPRAAPSRPMLAVLPFTALGAGEAGFAAGLTDELICAAERAAHVRVTPRAIMFQFRDGRYSLDEVATRAGSDLVLHGTIRQAQTVRRVSLSLYDRQGQILWSDRIDGSGDRDLAAQERMAAAIVARLPAPMMRARATG